VEEDFIWSILGLTLVIVELLTGTFYLLMLGIAAFGAALAAWLGQGFPVQVIVAAVISALGCYGVHMYRTRNSTRQMTPVDSGQPARFEGWIDEGARLARVAYRGASWDARVAGDAAVDAGALLYVVTANGNTLEVSTQRPA